MIVASPVLLLLTRAAATDPYPGRTSKPKSAWRRPSASWHHRYRVACLFRAEGLERASSTPEASLPVLILCYAANLFRMVCKPRSASRVEPPCAGVEPPLAGAEPLHAVAGIKSLRVRCHPRGR